MISETLEQGDVLYMPRGYLHEATTSDTTSLHVRYGTASTLLPTCVCLQITFAVPTADFAMGHFISEMIDGLARKVPSVRRCLSSLAPADRAALAAPQLDHPWIIGLCAW